MADITMCNGGDCPVKDKCYRFTAKPSEFRQSYFLNTPFKDDKCDMFWGEKAESIFNDLKDILNGL